MARSLHFPTDLNLDNARPLAPQWLTNQQETSGAGTQTIKSALVRNTFPGQENWSHHRSHPHSGQAKSLLSYQALDQDLPRSLFL